MKTVLMISAALLAAGCAGAIPYNSGRVDDQYRRESGRIEAMEQLQQLKRSCLRAGGIVQLPRQSSRRLPPTAFEMRGASCRR
ncbi:MAG: hypothetical protein WD795_19485 [Woeseia sp.]